MSEQTAAEHPGRTETSRDEAEAADRLLHGSSFGAAAAAYAEHRPGYAEAAVRWALEPVRDRQPVRVGDVGAGTGKLTATLLSLGAEVGGPDRLAVPDRLQRPSHRGLGVSGAVLGVGGRGRAER